MDKFEVSKLMADVLNDLRIALRNSGTKPEDVEEKIYNYVSKYNDLMEE